MSIDLNKLDSMLDNTLNQETTESLNEWIDSKQPLFTLTAEEVEWIKDMAEWQRGYLEYCIKTATDDEEALHHKPKLKLVTNLLTRIKQWQDENRTNN